LGLAKSTTPRGDRGCGRAPPRMRGVACAAPKAVNLGRRRIILHICGRYGTCPGPCCLAGESKLALLAIGGGAK
jgi:hypothetical protein